MGSSLCLGSCTFQDALHFVIFSLYWKSPCKTFLYKSAWKIALLHFLPLVLRQLGSTVRICVDICILYQSAKPTAKGKFWVDLK